jgi:Uma2 family endonuclease
MSKHSKTQPARESPDETRGQRALEAAHGAGHSDYITYEEFLDLVDEDTLAEWVDGAIVMTSPANLRHQEIGRFLLTTLGYFVRVHNLGRVIDPPFQVKLPRSGREPDVLYIANAHLDRLTPTYLDGPADLVVEIMSPESTRRDREEKFTEYQEAGIPEYWLLDPQTEHAEFYWLGTSGQYELVALDAEGIYRSRVVPGFWLRVAWLWRQPLPDPVQVLLEIDRDAFGRYLQEQLRQAGL